VSEHLPSPDISLHGYGYGLRVTILTYILADASAEGSSRLTRAKLVIMILTSNSEPVILLHTDCLILPSSIDGVARCPLHKHRLYHASGYKVKFGPCQLKSVAVLKEQIGKQTKHFFRRILIAADQPTLMYD